MMIKTTLLVLAAAGLTGCAVYPAAPYGAVYGPGPVYVEPQPAYVGGAVYIGPSRGYYHRGHRHGRHYR